MLDLATIGIAMETSGLERGTRALRDTEQAANKTADAADRTGRSMDGMATYASLASKALAGIGLGASIAQFLRTADSVTQLNNSLKLSTGSAQAASAAYSSLYQIAQRSRVSFIELGNTYSSIARATGDLGVSQARMLKVTESIANAMTIGGGSAQGMNAALVQLGQGMASGTLRGEELNSILEQAPRLAKALADGLGVPIGKLREMGAAGEISSQQIVKALESQSGVLSKEVTGATITLGQAFTKLANAGTKAVGEFDRASGASTSLAEAISAIASSMDGMGEAFKNNETIIKTVMGSLAGAAALATLSAIPGVITSIGAAVTGLGVILAANPIVLALLGVGAVVGGGVAAVSAYSKTADGIRGAVSALEEANTRSEAAMQRALDGGRTAGADNIRKTIEERRKAIRELNAELALMSSSGLDNRAEEARLAAGTEQMRAQRRAAEELAGIKQKLSGVDKDYLPTLNKLFAQYQAGSLTLNEYQGLVAKLAQSNYKPEKQIAGAKAEQTAYEALIVSIRSKVEAEKLELSGAAALTDSQRISIKLNEDLAEGRMKLTTQQRASIRAGLDELAVLEKQQAATREAIKIAQATADARNKEIDGINAWLAAQEQAAAQALASVTDRVRSLADEEEAARMAAAMNISLAEAVELVTIARLKEKSERQYTEGSDAAEAIKREIAQREKLLGYLGNKNIREREERGWTDMWQSVDRTAHDVFVNVFEGGSNVFKKLGQTLKASVLDVLYQMTVRRWIINIGTSIMGSGFGAAANAATGGGAGGMGGIGTAINGASMLSGLGAFSTGASYGMAGLMSGNLTGMMAAGGQMIGAGSIMSGLGTIAGALGPIALGVMAIASLIKPRTYHSGGAGSYSAAGGATTGLGVLDQGLTFGVGASHYDKAAETAAVQVAKSISGLLDSTAKTFGKDAGYYAATAFADDSSKDGAWGSLIIKRLDETILNWADTQTSKWAPKVFADGDKGKAEYMQELAASTKQAILSIGLPEWAERIASSMPDSGSMEDLAATLQKIQQYPAQLLEAYGTSRDALVQKFVEGLQTGNAQQAGADVANMLVDSIRNGVFGQAAGQIFDIVNMGIVTPVLDAIATGASVSEALSQATIDATIKRAKEQAAVLAELFGNAEFQGALEQIRTAVGSALGQAGASIQRLPYVVQQIDTAAQSAAQAADDARQKWQQITDGLLGTRTSLAIELLRAQGREEDALAMERAEAIKGMDAYQVGLYDANTGTRALIDSLTKMREISEQLASELPEVIAKFLTPEQNTAAQYGSIAGDLIKAGLSGMGADELTRALTGASKAEIAQAATAIYNMAGVTDEMRLALVRAAGSLADLKTEAEGMRRNETDAAMAALEKAVNARKALLQESIDDIRAVFDAVRDNARSLYGEVESTMQGLADAGRAFIDNALSVAKITGYLPNGKALAEAIGDVRKGINETQYKTQVDADRDRLVLAGKLSQLQAISGDQLTEAEKQLKALDDLLASSRAQIDALRGIDASVLSVEAAVSALASAMGREKAGGGGGGRPGSTQTVGGATTLHGANGAQYSTATGMGYQSGTGLPWFADNIRAIAADLVNAGNGKQVYDLIKSEGYTLSQANTILGLSEGTAEDWARAMGLPVYHQGTDYVPKTGFALLEQGERVIPRVQTGGNSERLERLVEGLTAEVKRLQAVVADGNKSTKQMADQFDNVSGGGNALRSEVVGA